MSAHAGSRGIRPRLMVLGAGAYQVPVMLAARAMDIEVIAVDRNASSVGVTEADRFEPVDTTDCERVLEVARRFDIDAIIAPCSDVAVPTQAYVAEHLKLVGPPPESALILTDKELFRSYQKRSGLPHPGFWAGDSTVLAKRKWAPGTYISKPPRSSGSKGIYVADHLSLDGALEKSVAYSADRRLVVEEHVAGDQGTIEGVWIDGKIKFHFITDRLTADAPHVATTGHRYPSRISTEAQREVLVAVSTILSGLAVKNTVFDCDFIASAKGVVVLELTPRLGGNSLSRLVLATTGRDLPMEAVQLMFDKSVDDFSRQAKEVQAPGLAGAIMVLHSPCAGLLAFNPHAEASLRRQPWVRHIEWDVEPGAEVRAFRNGRDRVGEALICAENRDELDVYCAQFDKELKITAT